jgi:hypothetical protein
VALTDRPGATVIDMMSLILASAATEIALAFGVGFVAIAVGAIAIYFSAGLEDRGKLATLARHPLREIFKEDEPDPDDWD